MHNILFKINLFFLALTLAGCSFDLTDTSQDDAGSFDIADQKGVFGTLPEMEYNGESNLTRSSLTFDFVKKIMKFSWDDSEDNKDKIGVLPESGEKNAQQEYILTVKSSDLNAKFTQEDPDVNYPVGKGSKYYSYRPVVSTHEGGLLVPVSFLNQKQTESPNMRAYYKREADTHGENTPNLDTYNESEKAASAHLGNYDFLVASCVAPSDNQLAFSYKRLGAIVRFYIRCPEQVYYDSIQVVNKDANFIIKADMDVTQSNSELAFKNNPVTSHVVSMEFDHLNNTGGVHGFNLDNSNNDNPYWRDTEEASKKIGYIVAYMMFAPIDLKPTNICQSTLYLIGHDKNNNKKYYQATAKLSRITIKQNNVQQWAPAGFGPDTPIEFIPVDVETWKEGTNFDNNGDGTEDW